MSEQHKEKADDTQSQPQGKPQTKSSTPPETNISQANIILDSLFTRGHYEEEVVLPGDRKCVLRTRSTAVAMDIISRLENADIKTAGKYNQMFSLYCLAGSLYVMGGKPLPDDFDKKIAIISDLPAPVTDMLVQKLSEFDKTVADTYTVDAVKN